MKPSKEQLRARKRAFIIGSTEGRNNTLTERQKRFIKKIKQ